MTKQTMAESGSTYPIAVAAASISLAAVPVFLLGAIAVFVRRELHFSEATLGLVVSSYYAASALMSVPGGRFTERIGGLRGAALAAAETVISMFGIAALGHS